MEIKENDYNNGDGVVISLWVSGCPHKCAGCHNPETHDKNNGYKFTEEIKQDLISKLENKYIEGLSILGGEPLTDYNYDEVLKLCVEIKKKLKEKQIWLWTGYTKQELINQNKQEILFYLDTLIDGRFVEELKEEHKYKGSSNQNVYKIKKEEIWD
jgi:anaerobic ribonucleoside-triphosphate reductase activating protein